MATCGERVRPVIHPIAFAVASSYSLSLRRASVLLALLLASPLRAQVCDGNVGLYTQDDVELVDCSEITGDLTIAGADIDDLTALSALTAVGGRLNIAETEVLASLDGLDALTSIGGTLYLRENSALESLIGLSALVSIGDDIYIDDDGALTSFEGLSSLGAVGGNLRIGGTSTIESLTGLDALVSIGGNVYLSGNSALESLEGLGALTSVGGSVYIDRNGTLTSLAGLGALASVGEHFQVSSNDALTSLAGLGALDSVGTYLAIGNNEALTSLEGLGALTSVGGYLSVSSNGVLSDCACSLLGLISGDPPAFTGVTFSAIFVNNAPDSHCNARADVLAASLLCEPVATEPAASGVDAAWLHPGFPNPFRPSAGSLRLRFRNPESNAVRLAVYDLQGREVTRLVAERLGPGAYEAVWDGTGRDGQALPAGVYLAVMEVGDFRQSRRITVVH